MATSDEHDEKSVPSLSHAAGPSAPTKGAGHYFSGDCSHRRLLLDAGIVVCFSIAASLYFFRNVPRGRGEVVVTDVSVPELSYNPEKPSRNKRDQELDEGLERDLEAGLSQSGWIHPGALNMIYSVSLYAQHIPGYNPSQTSLDQHFQLRAAEEGKTVIGLETVEDQINAAFYSEPVEVIAQSLVELVRNPEYTVNLVREVTKYYGEQDLDKLYEVSFENPDNPFEMEGMEKALLKERNDRWMEQLPKLMAEQSVFVAVGAGHLPGPDGILTQLRKAGYVVEEVK